MEYPQYDYAVIGGDMRQVYLAEGLARPKNRVCTYALMPAPEKRRCSTPSPIAIAPSFSKACAFARCIICPIPLSKNGRDVSQTVTKTPLSLDQLLTAMKPGCSFFAGNIPEKFKSAALEKGIFVYDLMQNYPLAVCNTVATAEGALCEAITKSHRNLHKSRCAVLGYGKCGRTLVQFLKGLFCQVYACSNDALERAQAAITADDAGSLEDFKKYAGSFDFIFNTIPAPVISRKVLGSMKTSVTIIDIASSPGGVDFAAARELGITAALCPGLPGKYAPSSSAQAIKETIESILSSESQP